VEEEEELSQQNCVASVSVNGNYNTKVEEIELQTLMKNITQHPAEQSIHEQVAGEHQEMDETCSRLQPNTHLKPNGSQNTISTSQPHSEISNETKTQNSGVMQQLGIYYAMGFALIFQGFFSMCYHICPTNLTLQYDTTLMYVMCTLGLVKTYQVNLQGREKASINMLKLIGNLNFFDNNLF
jgi:hypothetical protein